MKDHYKILGISPESSQDEIKKAYRLLALRHHPDRNNGSRHSEELFKQISESYFILADLSSRKMYDNRRDEQSGPAQGTPEAGNATAVAFLMIFRNVREKVIRAGGYIDSASLFEIINETLTTENLNYLVNTGDIGTHSLIIDELIAVSVFLDDYSKTILYRKLIRLAHGDAALREKVSVLSSIRYKTAAKPKADDYSSEYEYIFIVFMVMLIIFGVIMG